MESTHEERRLGDYLLIERLVETPLITTWLAEQVSVGRRVLVDELDPQRASRSAAFLADIRAKAAVDHPHVGTVYEAVIERDLCFYAHEFLPGATFEDRRLAEETFLPEKMAVFLRRIAEANLYHESHGFATSHLNLDSIHLDDHNVIRLKNLVIAGGRTPDQSLRDIRKMGEALRSLVALNQPGTTRIQSVLGWMRGEGVVEPIGWQDVKTFCEQIEEQLTGPLSNISAPYGKQDITKRKPILMISIITGAALAAIAFIAFKTKPPVSKAAARLPLPDPVLVPQGTYPTPDGTEETLRSFRISAHETTIGEYLEFLDALTILAKSDREKLFDPQGQPAEKTSHEPEDWAALLAAAKGNGTWKGRNVTLQSPVVGVDWWDAMTYAEWKGARLPTQEEWFAALRKSVPKPSALPIGNWLSAVTDKTPDRTPDGIVGMAGSVSEWILRPAPDPSNPLGESLRVIIGGSYLKPAQGALSREWTADRSLRRPDLGFRVVYEPDAQ
ncbi:SUMF1/EgtB/PvdO family nonheme iron enzyme [Luteolibacter sp. SL250]|uniref:SUMF1/EgtB/PvdO family nonheme iron enzyme n=1 Tax=Luteolibacter sp. SL250 TaxID=2995170 RepID=UPI0022701A7B|nr:SUMF1/EgtB/PvdO family nonheme iron enzyme [Luteolibacter sp. SL250]WAC20117.1 SUMF1/EgtB/PvdO family nonheme iron enzyme [Luteolibacter sp. SL250]